MISFATLGFSVAGASPRAVEQGDTECTETHSLTAEEKMRRREKQGRGGEQRPH